MLCYSHVQNILFLCSESELLIPTIYVTIYRMLSYKYILFHAFRTSGWIQTLSREKVKCQRLGNRTINSESASKIIPACEIWVLECMCKCLFFQRNIFVRFDGKTSSKMDEYENFLNLGNPFILDHAFVSFRLSIRILVLSPCWNSA